MADNTEEHEVPATERRGARTHQTPALWRRLPLHRKFAVVGLLGALPILFGASNTIGAKLGSASDARQAQRGADCVGAQLALIRQLGDARLGVALGQKVSLDVAGIDRTISKACGDVGADQSWRQSRLTIQNARSDRSEYRVAAWTKAIRAVRDNIDAVGERSGLTYEPAAATHHLFAMLAGPMAALIDQQSRQELVTARDASEAATPGSALSDTAPELEAPEYQVVRAETLRIRQGLRALATTTNDKTTRSAADQWRQSFERLDLSTDDDVRTRLSEGPNVGHADLDRFGGWMAMQLDDLLAQRAGSLQKQALMAVLVTLALVGFVVGLGIALYRSVAHPVRSLLSALEDGDPEAVRSAADLPGSDEFARIGSAVQATVGRLAERDAQAIRDTTQDSVTRLPSRAVALDHLAAAFTRQARDRIVSVSLVEVEDLQLINDTYGKHNGDEMLRTVARRLRRAVPEADLVARVSGGQFAVISERGVGVDDALDLAHSLLAALNSPMPLLDEPGVVQLDGANVGVVVCAYGHVIAPEQILEDAYVAIIGANALGRGQVCLFDSTLRQANRRRLDLRVEMRLASAGPAAAGFSVTFEPVVSASSGEVVFYESVLAWENPRFGAIPRDEFMPVAEQVGAVGALGRYVLDEAVQTVMSLRSSEVDVYVSLDVDERDIAAGELLPAVKEAVDSGVLTAEALCLAVRVSNLSEAGDAMDLVAELRLRGVRIAVDGASMGAVSSLSSLRPSVLKLDPALGSALHGNGRETAAAVVSSLVDLGHKLGLAVVVQGVSSADHIDAVRTLGADAFYGPVTALDLKTMGIFGGMTRMPSIRRAIGLPFGAAIHHSSDSMLGVVPVAAMEAALKATAAHHGADAPSSGAPSSGADRDLVNDTPAMDSASVDEAPEVDDPVFEEMNTRELDSLDSREDGDLESSSGVVAAGFSALGES